MTRTIAGVEEQLIGPEKQLRAVMMFEEDGRGLIMNKTNWKTCADAWDDDTDLWIGQKIRICPEKANFQGKVVDCLRLQVPGSGPKKERRKAVAPPDDADFIDDDDFAQEED